MPAENEPGLCVFCRRHPVDFAWRPFCSERCKLQDLAHWADGAYRVAAELSISPTTAARHVANILAKLGFTSRTQIAAWVADRPSEPRPADVSTEGK